MEPCARCDGSMIRSLDGPCCLSCGWAASAQPVMAGSKVTPGEVARWRDLRRRGWTFRRIGAGSEWTEAAAYMRLNGRRTTA